MPAEGRGASRVSEEAIFYLTSVTTPPTPGPVRAGPAPLGQRLLLVDPHIEEDGLHPQQHAALDLPRQGVEQRARQRDPHVKAIPAKQEDRQRAGEGCDGGEAGAEVREKRKTELAST